MVLLAELLLAVGILVGVYRLATRPRDGMAEVEPDRRPAERQDGPLTADELVTMHIPMGFGYRKVDVDLLLDRIARQLPRATPEAAAEPAYAPSSEPDAERDAEPATDPGLGVPGQGPFAATSSRTDSAVGSASSSARADEVPLRKEDDGG